MLETWIAPLTSEWIRPNGSTLLVILEGKIVQLFLENWQMSHLKDSTDFFENKEESIHLINEKGGWPRRWDEGLFERKNKTLIDIEMRKITPFD